MRQRQRRNRGKELPPAAATAAAPITRKEKIVWAAILLAAYVSIGAWGQFDFSDLMGYYNLLADGFLQGHLYIAQTPAQGYLQDMVPFEGRYYLQWGPFPALLHLAVKLVGLSLSDRVACILAGWLTSLVFLEILLVLWQRDFPDLPGWTCGWFFFAFALGTPTAIVALRGTVYHESIAIATLFSLWGFLALVRYAENPSPRWLLLGGTAIGLALATRVPHALYAAGLLAGFAALERQAGRAWETTFTRLALFSGPVLGAGLLMMAYNQARFGSMFEYGVHPGRPLYSLDRVWENFRHYVLAPIHVSRDLPWIRHIGWPPLVRTMQAEDMSSLFLASPFLLLGALGCGRLRGQVRILIGTAAGSAGLMFFSLLCYFWTARRFLQDFVPLLMVVAFAGAASRAAKGDGWRRWRFAAWAVLACSALLHVHLVFFQPLNSPPADLNVSKAFVTLSPLVRRILPRPQLDAQEAIHHNELGILALNQGRFDDAIRHFERAGQLTPDSPLIPINLRMARQMKAAAGR